jgi:hypothetical protein
LWPGLLPEMILKGWFSIPLVNMSLGSSKNRAYLPTIGLSWFIQCLSNVYPMFIMVYHGLFNVYPMFIQCLSWFIMVYSMFIPDEMKIN